MGKIETGVDKLVDLVLKKKKISLDEAAKELGVSKEVVLEWAEFLEEEQIIGIEYSFSKTYLVEKKLSKKDLEKKAKQYEDKKEAFIRKIDTTLTQLNNEVAGFEEIRKAYQELKEDIGGEIDEVKHELDELRHYEELKRSMDSDIMKQRLDYEKMVDSIHSKLSAEEKRYKSLITGIHEEEDKLEKKINEVKTLREKEESLKKRLDALRSIVDSLDEQISVEEKEIGENQYRLQRLRDLALEIEKELKYKSKKEIEPLVKASEKHKEKILKIQDSILAKVKAKKNKITDFEKEGDKIIKKFDVFFKKRARTEELLLELEKKKEEMKHDLEEMKKKAEAYSLLKTNKSIQKQMQELESAYKRFLKKKASFKAGVEKLKKIISE